MSKNTSQSGPVEVVEPAIAALVPDAVETPPAVILTGPDFVRESGRGWDLYLTPGRFTMLPANRKPRKPVPTDKLGTIPQYAFGSILADGSEVSFTRYALTATQLADYLSLTDAVEREAFITAIPDDKSLPMASTIKPVPDRMPLIGSAFGGSKGLREVLATGTFAVPKAESRGDSKGRANGRKLTAEEQTAAMLEEAFGAFDAVESESDADTDAVAALESAEVVTIADLLDAVNLTVSLPSGEVTAITPVE